MTDPRLDPHHDARLSELIHDAVAGVEPGEGLTAIRSRTRPDRPGDHHEQLSQLALRRPPRTAAVIVAIAVVSQLNDDGNGSDPVAQPSSSQTSDPTGEPSPTESAERHADDG